MLNGHADRADHWIAANNSQFFATNVCSYSYLCYKHIGRWRGLMWMTSLPRMEGVTVQAQGDGVLCPLEVLVG